MIWFNILRIDFHVYVCIYDYSYLLTYLFYSTSNYIWDYIDIDCIIVFDELVNYPGFDGDKGELKAFYEFITENKVDYEWIGMNGTPTGMSGYYHENVALIIHSIN